MSPREECGVAIASAGRPISKRCTARAGYWYVIGRKGRKGTVMAEGKRISMCFGHATYSAKVYGGTRERKR